MNVAPARHVALDKRALWRSIERDDRARDREQVRKLKARVRELRAARTKALRDVKARCTAERLKARERARQIQEDAKREARRIREEARSTCSADLETARGIREEIERGRDELAAEQKFQADMRRIERGNRQREKAKPRASARERREESDDEVRSNLPDDLIPVFNRVRRQIKGTSRMSRTEAFLQYLHENPEQVDADRFAEIDDETERLIAELEQRDAEEYGGRRGRRNPSRARRLTELGKLTAIEWQGGFRAWPLKKAPTLAYDARGRLHIVYALASVGAATGAERREYERTHWGQSGRGRTSEGDVMDGGPVRELGAGTSITYTTRKGSKELVDWVHEWGDGARGRWKPPIVVEHVCRSAKCAASGTLALRGGTYRVTERGIVG